MHRGHCYAVQDGPFLWADSGAHPSHLALVQVDECNAERSQLERQVGVPPLRFASAFMLPFRSVVLLLALASRDHGQLAVVHSHRQDLASLRAQNHALAQR